MLVTGRAYLVSDPALLERVAEALDAKYRSHRTARPEMPAPTRRHYEDADRATIEIRPDDRILSWDNARLGLSLTGGGRPVSSGRAGQPFGRPSACWAMMSRWISDIPPARVPATDRRTSPTQSRSSAPEVTVPAAPSRSRPISRRS